MGLFDLIDDVVDAAVKLPGKVVETATEAVVRIPEAGIRTVKGVVDGMEKGIEKMEKSLDE